MSEEGKGLWLAVFLSLSMLLLGGIMGDCNATSSFCKTYPQDNRCVHGWFTETNTERTCK